MTEVMFNSRIQEVHQCNHKHSLSKQWDSPSSSIDIADTETQTVAVHVT